MARTDNFQKFVKQKKGSAIKEEIKQAKKKEKKERAAAIEEHFAKKRAAKAEQLNQRQQGEIPEAPVKTAKPGTNKYADKAALKQAPKTAEKIPTKNAPQSQPKGETPFEKASSKSIIKSTSKATDKASAEQMPLNKYIAHSGVCSRRDAAAMVKNGQVTINGVVATDPGTKVLSTDEIKVAGKKITPSKNFVYILLNKPKDYITTSEDPQGRKTVLDLVRTATTERVYPIGRLDRNTSGVLLLTNDGDLAQKLSHPKHEIKKVYEVKLDRPLTKADMDKIASGIVLEDGLIAPDVIAYADSKDKSIIGIEIHSGRNRIVRRIFEHMKYDVKALDRVMFAGLTKKDVQRGNWRLLKEKELRILKYMNQSYVKNSD